MFVMLTFRPRQFLEVQQRLTLCCEVSLNVAIHFGHLPMITKYCNFNVVSLLALFQDVVQLLVKMLYALFFWLCLFATTPFAFRFSSPMVCEVAAVAVLGA